jgi:hypothetical protein
VRPVATLFCFVVLVGCSGSSGEVTPSRCDAGACDMIAQEIIKAVPPGMPANNVCVNPKPQFMQACADYEQCLRQCGEGD